MTSVENPGIPAPHGEGNDPAQPRRGPSAQTETAREAARQFEGLMVRELMKVLRKTVPESSMNGSGFSGQMYTEMLDDALADELAKGTGLGMRDMLERSLGGDPTTGTAGVDSLGPEDSLAHLVGTVRRPGLQQHYGPRHYTSEVQERLHLAAAEMLAEDGAQWGREGRLSHDDLRSDFATGNPGHEARFNVRDANGYQGYYKCNLFAFEMARRAGFQVPVVGRNRGWGYPAPNRITQDAADGSVEHGWARVATQEPAARLDQDLQAGRRAFMLTGEATGERAGHMAVVERIHSIDRDSQGRVTRVVFDGWEARTQGAEHLSRRTWNIAGNAGGTLARNGFAQIEVLEMRSAGDGEATEIPTSSRAGSSKLDNLSQDRTRIDR